MAEIPLKIIFDEATQVLRDSAGTEITTNELFPSATFGQKFMVNVQITIDDAGTIYPDIEAGSTADIYVENDYSNPSPILGLPSDTTEDWWTVDSGSEYHYNGTEVEAEPASVYFDGTIATKGTLGALSAGEWAWDGGNSRLVVRLTDSSDPDTKADGWVGFKVVVASYTKPFIEVDSSTFNQANSWYDEGTELFRDPVITDGEMSFEVNANSFDFWNRIGTKNWIVDTTIQIQLLAPSTAENYKIIEFQFVCRNKYLGSNYTVDVVGANVYTKGEVDALLAGYQEKHITFVASLDFKTAQENTVYTVPADKKFLPERGIILTDAITGIATPPTYKWLADVTDLMPATVASMNAVNEYDSDDLDSPLFYGAGAVIKMEVTSAGTSTTHTGKAIIKGVLVDA